MPDLDEPKSIFGKYIAFVSVPLNKLFDHLSFLHSLLFAISIGRLLAIVPAAQAGLIARGGIGVSCRVGDMLIGKAKLLHPLKIIWHTNFEKFIDHICKPVSNFRDARHELER